ncbi:hypothetical protein EOB59_05495 [Mesorhizobium sp. M7A.F.Ca.MR.176.00.0.0]|uniref:hypothetical protein n=1 Tax=Mesorhizobium sp. M7A.F.Ca.MR.176.00.0.0 TaxID=2496776 RepID=UPI000FD2EE9D|nr:hypothetical protein [Mesorhizobium sp. M7A.F.Ca.MR.176.00.0.0]RUU92813.1 hypothetical protein EOB59_05495 [Mesorhizobium sp. M7A.F.Ca.MR.176.00.0.0]
MSHDLNLILIADGQADDQWQSSNDGLTQLANGMADIYTVDFSGGNVALTSAQFRSAMTFVPSGLSATRILTLPAVKRALFIVNNTDAADTINVTKGSTTIAVGPGEIGLLTTDGTTNDLGGTVVHAGGGSVSPIGKHTLWVPAGAMTARTSNGAAAGSVETTTNKVMLKTLDFDASADEHAQFSILMPKSWDEGTVTFKPVWSHAATATNFGVAWFCQGLALSNDDAADSAFGTAQSSVDTGGTTNDIYVGPESSAITIGGTPAEGDLVVFQIYRDVSDAGDTMAIDARLHGVHLYLTTNAATDA